jgi:hypothetical protein
MNTLHALSVLVGQGVELKDSFANLWKQYYTTLFNFLFTKCDPLVLNQIDDEIDCPSEIKKYFVESEMRKGLVRIK